MSAGYSWTRETAPAYEDPWKNPPAGYGRPRMTDTVGFHWVCEQCGGMVSSRGVEIHDAWHARVG